jgi:hypothetical protein
MSIRKQIVLRYRSAGHARFDIPAFLRQPERFERLLSGLRRVEGVYRIDGLRERGKLSIRYQDWALDFPALLREFDAIVTELERLDAAPPHRSRTSLGRGSAQLKAWFDSERRGHRLVRHRRPSPRQRRPSHRTPA